MRFGKQNSYKNYIYSRPVIVVLLILVVLLSISVYERLGVERDMSERRYISETALEELQKDKTTLQTKVEYFEGERGIEEEIRKNFDVAKEGEQVIILVGEDKAFIEMGLETEVVNYPWYQFWR